MDLADRVAQRVVERVHGAVALGRAHVALAARPDLDRGLRGDLAVGALLDQHAPGLEAEQRFVRARLLAHQELEGPVGGLELEAAVLEVLDALEHPAHELLAGGAGLELDPRRGRLLGDRPAARELGDEDVAAVAHHRRVDVLERLRVGANARRVQPRLVREGMLADVRLGGVGGAVEELVDEVRRLGEARQLLGRKHLSTHLQLQVGDHRDQVGVAGALADAVDRALHLRRSGFDRRERVGDRAAGVVVGVDAQRDPAERFADDGERRSHCRRQRSAVGVAQDHPLRPRLGRGAQAAERVAGVELEAVEEVLGVEQHALSGGREKRHRVGDHAQVLLARDAHDLLHVQERGLAHERARRDRAAGQHAQPLVGVGGAVAPPRHPEGDQLGALKALAGEQLEQLLLLRVGRGKAGLDQRDPEGVERVHDAQLLLSREAQASAAHAVAQGGVV